MRRPGQIDLTPNRLARYLSGLGGSQNPLRPQRWTAREDVSLGLTAQATILSALRAFPTPNIRYHA